MATNPIFPAIATESRIRWAGLEPEEFELYTTYENTCYCKPNPDYYRDLLQRLDCQAEECLMIGNDVEEDMIAESIGMKVFLLTDCMIKKKERDISVFLMVALKIYCNIWIIISYNYSYNCCRK